MNPPSIHTGAWMEIKTIWRPGKLTRKLLKKRRPKCIDFIAYTVSNYIQPGFGYPDKLGGK